jgi:K+-sensing histidine kinase KdpD
VKQLWLHAGRQSRHRGTGGCRHGCGVGAEEKERLFLPYFSTKGRGTGLGLAFVSRIMPSIKPDTSGGQNAHARASRRDPRAARRRS